MWRLLFREVVIYNIVFVLHMQYIMEEGVNLQCVCEGGGVDHTL